MRSGDLRHQLVLQVMTVTRSNSGAEIPVWTDFATVWASIEPKSGKKYFQSQQFNSETTHLIGIRCRRNVTTRMRGKIGTRIFEFLSVVDVNERRTELQIEAKEVA